MLLISARWPVAGIGLIAFKSAVPLRRTSSSSVLVCAVLVCGRASFRGFRQSRTGHILMLMPSRLLNVNAMVFAALSLRTAGSVTAQGTRQQSSRSLCWRRRRLQPAWSCGRAWGSWADVPGGPLERCVLCGVRPKPRGLVLTGGSLHLIQLRTRRPVLIDGGGLDALPYATEAGPEMRRVLSDVYGIDLLSPPSEAQDSGVVPDDFNKDVWPKYSPSKWRTFVARIT